MKKTISEKVLLKVLLLLIVALIGHNIYLQVRINDVEQTAEAAYYEAGTAAAESAEAKAVSDEILEYVKRIWNWM